MFPYFLDFHENIRFSKTLSEYQEQPYPILKTTVSKYSMPLYLISEIIHPRKIIFNDARQI